MNKQRVVRGGAWYINPWLLHSVNRSAHNASYQLNYIGFRLIQEGSNSWQRGVRGGSWFSAPGSTHSAVRRSNTADHSNGSLGFRLVLEQKT